jgi:hypothetical protein
LIKFAEIQVGWIIQTIWIEFIWTYLYRC